MSDNYLQFIEEIKNEIKRQRVSVVLSANSSMICLYWNIGKAILEYHLKLRCYVVIELKACDFEPGFISQLNMYQNAVNDILCHPDDKPTIGLLLVKGKNKTVVEYSLAGYQNPIGVAKWKNQIEKSLPEELRSSLPTIEEIEKELDNE